MRVLSQRVNVRPSPKNPHPPLSRRTGRGSQSVFRSFVVCAILLITSVAHAEPTITLPLEGYYRPGKFFPVRIESDQSVEARVQADGVSSRGSGRSMVLPAMSLSRVPDRIRVTIDGKTIELPIRPLEASQKLTVTFGEPWPTPVDQDAVRVSLALARLEELTQAYESADLILARVNQAADLSTPAVAALNAAGVRIGVLIDEPAGGAIFSPTAGDAPVRGPATSLDASAAYDAAAAFAPSRSAPVRQIVWLATALFAILTTGLALIRRRWSAAGILAAVILWTLAAGIVFARASPISERRGAVMHRHSGVETELHRWQFRTSSRRIEDGFTVDPRSFARPLFADNAQTLGMWIEVRNDGWRYHYTLKPQAKAAFVFSGLNGGATRPMPADRINPLPVMMDIAKAYYQRPGDTLSLLSEGDSSPVWMEVVLVKSRRGQFTDHGVPRVGSRRGQ